jgi:plasmid maintenance system killer protein
MQHQQLSRVLLFIAIFFVASCQNGIKTTKQSAVGNAYPAAVGFNANESDAAAIAIAEQVMQAQGGFDNWQQTQYIQWTFFGKRTLLWDKFSGNVRIELSEDLQNTIIVNIHTSEGKAEKDGIEVTDEAALNELLHKAKSIWINDSYWLTMPYKLKDSGVTLKYIKQDKVDDLEVDVLQLTFENVGDTPDNKYLIYVDKKSHLVVQWAFFTNFEDEAPRFVTPWADYKQYGNILLSGDRGQFKLSDIAVLKEVSMDSFEKL